MASKDAGNRRERLPRMPGYTIVNLREVEDSARKFGMPEEMQARFARVPLELANQGMSLFTLAPGFRLPFGHRHGRQEEVYVIVAGSVRMKLDDELVELRTWDAIRLPPE